MFVIFGIKRTLVLSVLVCTLITLISSDADGLDDIWSLDGLFETPESNETEIDPKIRFILYTNHRNLSDSQELLIKDLDNFSNSSFNASAPTKLLIHGFMASCNTQIFPGDVIKAYLKKNKGENIICVDWSSMANPPVKIPLLRPFYYTESVSSTLDVGEKVAEFLAYTCDKNLTANMSDVHIVGLSLGAHIAGIAGFNLKDKYKLTLGRITGLDPAAIFFKSGRRPLRLKLDSSDAGFVDIIHTNMDRLGLSESVGHVSFLPNGGKIQPRCYREADFIANLKEQVSGQCSHMIAATYFKESVVRGNIRGCKASSWEDFLIMNRRGGPCETAVPFGEDCPSSTRGQYYLHI